MSATKVISNGGAKAIESQEIKAIQVLALIDSFYQCLGVQLPWVIPSKVTLDSGIQGHYAKGGSSVGAHLF